MRLLITLSLATLAACGGSDPGVVDVVLIDDDTDDTVSTDPGSTPDACGAVELCTRTIDDCDIDLTLESCTAWYDEPTNCADMDAYTACNCDCVEQDTCDGYFACGDVCFADHC